VSGYLIGSRELTAAAAAQGELAWWYQFYFATEPARRATAIPARLCQAHLQLGLASVAFDAATFERSAAGFDNPIMSACDP